MHPAHHRRARECAWQGSPRLRSRRLREKAERQQAAAELWERGAEGERAVADALTQLPTSEWAVLHDVAWPGRQRANIAHLAVGPGGIFVIDAKNCSGRIEVKNQVLRQNGRPRDTSVVGVGEASIAVTRLIGSAAPVAAVPVLCFHRDEPISGWAHDAMVCSSTNVAEMLRSRPPVLSPEQVREVSRILTDALHAAGATGSSRSRQSVTRTPAAPRARKARTGSKQRRVGRLAPAIVAALVGLAIATPGVFPAITGVLSDFVVSTAADDEEVIDPPARVGDRGENPRRSERPQGNTQTRE